MNAINQDISFWEQVVSYLQAHWEPFNNRAQLPQTSEELTRLEAAIRSAKLDGELYGSAEPSREFLEAASSFYLDTDASPGSALPGDFVTRLLTTQPALALANQASLFSQPPPDKHLSLVATRSQAEIPAEAPIVEISSEVLIRAFLAQPNLRVHASGLNLLLGSRLSGDSSIIHPEHCMAGCMDEGVKGEAIGLGGPGIVLAYYAGKQQGKDGWQAIVNGVPTVRDMLKGKIAELTSHDGCGASNFIYRLLPNIDRLRFPSSDALGLRFAALLAKRLTLLEGRLIPHHHISAEHLERPIDERLARLVFYAGTTYFNADKILGTNPYFTLSRGLLSAVDPVLAGTVSKTWLKLVVGIANGPNGLGDDLSESRPLIIVPVGGDLMSSSVLFDEALEFVASLTPETARKLLVLKGFDLNDSGPDSTQPNDDKDPSPGNGRGNNGRQALAVNRFGATARVLRLSTGNAPALKTLPPSSSTHATSKPVTKSPIRPGHFRPAGLRATTLHQKKSPSLPLIQRGKWGISTRRG